jgi:uncharacterized protein
MSDTPLGRFCWYELLTSDPDAAGAFYGQVAGWSAEPWEGSELPYTVWMNGEAPVGGFMQLPEEAVAAGAPPHWLAYLSTPDADATMTRAQEMGASVLWGPKDVPSVGRVAGLQDPQGAVFAIHQPSGQTPGHDQPASVGGFSWHELATADGAAGWEFYSDLFGWEATDQMDMGEMGIYQMFGRGVDPLGGIFNMPPEIPFPNWLLYIRVEDLTAAVDTVTSRGGRVVNGPMEVPGGDMIAQCMDPQGAAFALHASQSG